MKFLKSVVKEMKLVEWPTANTLTVVLTSIGYALFLGACDWIFSKLITLFVTHK